MPLLTSLHHRLSGVPGQLFFCQGTGSNPFGDLALWTVLVAATALLTILWLCLQIGGKFKRSPSVDVELAKLATKKELEEMAAKTAEAMAAMERRIGKRGDDRERALSEEIAALALEVKRDGERTSVGLQSIQRVLGQLEGKLSTPPAPK